MAKRSDFAQKLLDDLRLRKERMAAAQTTKTTNRPSTSDAYTYYSKRSNKGSMELKAYENKGIRAGSTSSRSNGGNKLLTTGQASNQIVTFGGGNQKTEHMRDLSAVLSFALENGGKLGRLDSAGNVSVLSFLHQIGRRDLDYGKMERRNGVVDRHQASSSRLRSLSNLHIEEISKGAQKLNMILSACSNGKNFDKYSIEIGKELLKGAVDLEESLRMLVNLQEASDYMVKPQRKSRITLLDDDEDDDSSVMEDEHKQLSRPKNYYSLEDIKLRLAALTYSSEAVKVNQQKKAPAGAASSSHKRSISYGPDTGKNRVSSSQSKQENGRIPSVIAKLMGLEELPGTGSSTKPKGEQLVLKKAAQESNKKVERRILASENLNLPASVVPAVHDIVISEARKNLVERNGNMRLAIQNKAPALKNMEDMKSVKGSRKDSLKIDNEQNNTTQLNLLIRNRKEMQEKEKKGDSLKHSEQKGIGKGEIKKLVSKEELHQMIPDSPKRPEAVLALPEKIGPKESKIQGESGNTNKFLQSTLGLQEADTSRKPKPRDKMDRVEEKKHEDTKKQQARKQRRNGEVSIGLMQSMHTATSFQKKKTQKDQATASRKGTAEHNNEMQVRGFQNGRHHEDQNGDSSSVKRATSQKSESVKAGNKPTGKEKQVEEQPTAKARGRKAHKPDIPRMIDEVMIKKAGTLYNLPQPLKHHSSNLHTGKPKGHEKFPVSREADQGKTIKNKVAEAHIVKSNKVEASSQSFTETLELRKEDHEDSISCCPLEDKVQSLESQASATNDKVQSIEAKIENDQQVPGSELVANGDAYNSAPDQPTDFVGTYKESAKMPYPSELEHRKLPKSEKPEPLTDNEEHLKQILIRSQLFLKTAEALFKLRIPSDILESNDHSCQDKESKIILDCGYEVMRRKGRRQELSVHPFMKVYIPPKKVKTLDDLAKKLHRDFEKLKNYTRNGDSDDYIPKIIENEVCDMIPDVNCMWDMGWNETMFAFLEKDDVIRDVERHVFNGLLDEITMDLYTGISVSA